MTERARILVVDDSPPVRAVLRAQLESRGHEVVEAEDGPGAVAAASSQEPDVILLDIQLPGYDGFEVLNRLRADETLKEIPVVFVTSEGERDAISRALELGGHDHLRKPVDQDELAARVRAALRTKRLQDELKRRDAEVDDLVRTDPLTRLANRRHTIEHLRMVASAARRMHRPLSVILVDVDHFKRLNDTQGYTAGDEVLRIIADRISHGLRGEDIAGRWGGEEFILVLPGTNLDGAWTLADRVRVAVSDQLVRLENGDELVATISLGCAEGDGSDLTDLLRRADSALAEAKSSGRNRAVADTSTTPFGRAPSSLLGQERRGHRDLASPDE